MSWGPPHLATYPHITCLLAGIQSLFFFTHPATQLLVHPPQFLQVVAEPAWHETSSILKWLLRVAECIWQAKSKTRCMAPSTRAAASSLQCLFLHTTMVLGPSSHATQHIPRVAAPGQLIALIAQRCRDQRRASWIGSAAQLAGCAAPRAVAWTAPGDFCSAGVLRWQLGGQKEAR